MESTAKKSDFIGYPEAAELAGIKLATLYAWVSQRRIPHYRISRRCVRFSRSALIAWLQAHAVSSAEQRTP